jgi:chemotaxis regulatin CheY-phosphate phosphatase CheZ
MSKLYERLPYDVSDRVASCIENTVSSDLRRELAALRKSVRNYEEDHRDLKQEIIAAVKDAVSRNNNTVLVIREQIDQIPEHLTRQLKIQASVEDGRNVENSQANSRLEQLVNERSDELEALHDSLGTIAELRILSRPSQSSEELIFSSRTSFLELQDTFVRW